ncbi:MAG: hypothetical protein JWO03_923 [Bacteroidetes bacterium]|nr:hypothetical protein [Bacteroidota bacterium]
MTPQIPRPWTHWANYKEKRIFLVVDRPVENEGDIVIMEVKEYDPDEKRIFKHIKPVDWMLLTQDGKQLKPYTPRL